MARIVLLLLAATVLVTAQAPFRALFRDACQDLPRIQSLGTRPLTRPLQAVAALQNPRQVAAAIGRLHRFGAFAAFRVGRQPVPARQRNHATQAYARRLFALLGDPASAAAQEARTAINMEISLLPVPPVAPEQRFRLAQLQRLAPNFDWKTYWTAMGAPVQTQLLVSPDAVRVLNARLLLASPEQWKRYLRWCWLRATAALLPPPFVAAHFAFTRGSKPPPRASLCRAEAAAFPAAAFSAVPLRRDDYFGDMLHLRAWRVRQRWPTHPPARTRTPMLNSTSLSALPGR